MIYYSRASLRDAISKCSTKEQFLEAFARWVVDDIKSEAYYMMVDDASYFGLGVTERTVLLERDDIAHELKDLSDSYLDILENILSDFDDNEVEME